MEIAFDRAYQYILDQRQRELVMQRDIDEKTGVTDSSAQSVEQGTPKAVHEANNAEGISKEISDLAEKSEKHTRAEAYVNSPDVLIQLEAIFNGTDIPPAVQTKLIEHMKKYALQQQIDNPEQYVSHGFDHTLRVKAKMEMVMEMNPKIVDAIMQKYNLPPEKARMLAQVLAVYHDFGYAYVPNGPDRKPLRKALHAVTGAEIASDPELQSILRECFDSSANMNEILFDLKN